MNPLEQAVINIVAPIIVELGAEHGKRILALMLVLLKQAEVSGVAVIFGQESTVEFTEDMKSSVIEFQVFAQEEISAVKVDAQQIPATLIDAFSKNFLGLFSKFI